MKVQSVKLLNLCETGSFSHWRLKFRQWLRTMVSDGERAGLIKYTALVESKKLFKADPQIARRLRNLNLLRLTSNERLQSTWNRWRPPQCQPPTIPRPLSENPSWPPVASMGHGPVRVLDSPRPSIAYVKHCARRSNHLFCNMSLPLSESSTSVAAFKCVQLLSRKSRNRTWKPALKLPRASTDATKMTPPFFTASECL